MAAPLKIGFLGAGKMATALALGFLNARLVKANQLVAADPFDAARKHFADETGAKTVSNNLEAAKAASVKKGADALSKAGAKAAPKGAHKPMAASSEPVESDDDGDASGGDEDAQAAPSGESNKPAPASGATVPDLFGA